LVADSVVEALKTVDGVARELASRHGAAAIVGFAAALLPAGAIIFWGLRAIAAQLRCLVSALGRHWSGGRHVATAAALRWPEPVARGGGRSAAPVWMGAAFLAALGLAGAALALAGIGDKGFGDALQLTGRWSFLLFWPAYVGGAAAALFGPRFGLSGGSRRAFGLAYAAAQLVHFGLVVWLIRFAHQSLVAGLMPFFFVGIVWTYVLALGSVDRLVEGFGSNLWRSFQAVGLEYITLVFFADFVLDPIRGGVAGLPFYLPFTILTIAGPVLRMAAVVPRAARRLASVR
jgi:hypothetical protein